MKPRFAAGWTAAQTQHVRKTSRGLCRTTRRTFCCSTSRLHCSTKAQTPVEETGRNGSPRSRVSVGYEITELSITSSDDVAFCHSLNRIHGTRTGGEHTDVWVRATLGLVKSDGKWTIRHEHYSVPLYMDTPYKA